MSNYLSAIDLAELVGCRQNSYACMRRWLDKNGWPYAQSRTGMPIVSKAYHDARMAGEATKGTPAATEPNYAAFA